ncbi:MAG: ABC transporter ATP-binding protein [Gammaproteobacteria bacterium]|nr:ABC transporter ATP-binding protein [Gammaproteobacteria bacterium]
MNNPVLRIDRVTKRFGAVQAVKGVSLDIDKGEFFAILGPSGSGKTTLLRIIAGLETPDVGTVHIADRDVTRLPPYERRIGMVFQDFLLFPHKTVSKNIAFPLKMQGVLATGQDEQVRWALDFVRLTEVADRYPHQLSGGQKQRVALARGLVARPEILLLDEPLANLDRELRKEMEVEVRRYQVELGIPFVYVTHNQEEALTMSDRIAVMDQGLFEQVGPKLEVYAKPANRFVASFVGSANRIVGSLVDVNGETASLDWDGEVLNVVRPNGAEKGDRVELFIKSERIRIDKPGDGESVNSTENRIRGRLLDIIFKGQYADYLVRLNNGAEIVVSDTPDISAVSRSDEVEVSWQVDAGDCFAVKGEATPQVSDN